MGNTAGQCLTFEPGSKLDGYTIEKQIGEGGMAVLFLAHDESGRQCVLKVPRRTLDTDPVAVVAFENELRLARYLEDFPHAYMPVPQSGGERPYLVLDYIDGTDLWTHMREHGCFGEAQAIALTKKIVYALAELHRRRIVHLDIKLSNVMVTREGEVRLIDFGLANHLDLPDLIYESFKEPKGSPAYIAPEQFFGVRNEPRSDLFSIGTMLYEMTTSKLPFPDARTELGVVNRIKGGVVSPRHYRPELSDSFVTLVLTCLQTIPDRRFASMDALYMAMEQMIPAAEVVGVPSKAVQVNSSVMSGSKLLGQITGKFRAIMRSAENDKFDEINTWIAQHRAGRTPRYRIVAAYDCASDERTTALNRDILAQAIRQAGLQPSIITVLTVLSDHNAAFAASGRERKELNAAYLEVREAITRVIGSSARDDLPITVTIRSGDPVAAIVGCVVDYEADLLVIGARKRNLLSRFALGSTAYKVLTTIKCPVIVIQEGEANRSRIHGYAERISDVQST
jgi:eukaryotic-like serine/threonine-protein kinase